MKIEASGIGEKELEREALSPSSANEAEHEVGGAQPEAFPCCQGWLPCYDAAVGSTVKMYINIGAF